MSDAHRCPDIVKISTESAVSALTGKPFVIVVLTFADGSTKAIAQQTPEETRVMSLRWLTTAEAAIHDAAMTRWMRERMGADPATAAQALVDLRNFREDEA